MLGGVHKWFKVFANNHRTNLGLNKEDAVEVYYNAVALFAELKQQLRMGRVRLRRLWNAAEQFHLAATAQNLKRLLQFVARGQPVGILSTT